MVLRSLRFPQSLRLAGAAFILGALAAPMEGAADPLDKEACGKLQSEKQALVVLGVDKEFAKGPEWAKANLGQAELNLLKRYLTIDEQLKFRCGMAMVNLTIPPDEDGPDEVAAPTARVPLPERRDQSATAKPPAKPATAPVQTQPAGVVKPAAPAAPAKTAPKPAPKAQSSWNTETAPVETTSPAAIEQLDVAPKGKGDRLRTPQQGDRG